MAFCWGRLRWRDCLRAIATAGCRARAAVSGGDLRLLAHESGVFSDALRGSAGAALFGIRVVSVGMGAEGIQPDYSAREYVAAGVLGAHRICVRALFDFAERAVQHFESDGGSANYLSGDGCAFGSAHAMEEAPG